MGCDIHIVIQRFEDGAWREVVWQSEPYDFEGAPKAVEGVPIAPDVFDGRNYDLFGILANVRNGIGFAGSQMGEGWPSIAAGRGWPADFDLRHITPDPQYREESRYLGDHSFTWLTLEELKDYRWDATESWLYGVVPADEYDRLAGAPPEIYCGGVMGPGIKTYEPDEYKAARETGTLVERPHVRMGWPMTARAATGDWPGQVIPWLETLADGKQLRLILGFDS